MHSKLVAALSASTAVWLHGCGSGGNGGGGTDGGSTTTQAAATTTSTTTTTTTKFRTEPWTVEEAVEAMNFAYMGYDAENDTSPLGVTISMAAQPTQFNDNLFCHDLMHTSCFEGQADCRMSASILNHKFMVDYNGHPMSGLERQVGYLFNQTKVETLFGKCATIYDGASGNNVNGGCGKGARGGTDCNNPLCAYNNQCDMHGAPHTCTRHDDEVKQFLCECKEDWCADGGYGYAPPPQRRENVVCAYEMPAFLGPVTETNHLRDMMHQRSIFQEGRSDLVKEWNEIVLDNNILIPEINRDPATTILAFIYTHKENNDAANKIALQTAEDMRDGFMRDYEISTTNKVPVIALRTDWSIEAQGAAFSKPPDMLRSVAV